MVAALMVVIHFSLFISIVPIHYKSHLRTLRYNLDPDLKSVCYKQLKKLSQTFTLYLFFVLSNKLVTVERKDSPLTRTRTRLRTDSHLSGK